MDRCTGHCDITEILLKAALNTVQSNLFRNKENQATGKAAICLVKISRKNNSLSLRIFSGDTGWISNKTRTDKL